jgi:hypothetical protein
MKHLLFRLCALLALASLSAQIQGSLCDFQYTNCVGACNICSHTFFRPRPISQDLSLELALHQYNMYFTNRMGQSCNECKENHSAIDFQATGFFYQSTQSKEIAQFFSPHCKEQFTIGQNNASDISSAWLDLLGSTAAPYFSLFSLNPRRQAGGINFKFYVDFRQLFSEITSCWAPSWFSLYIPVVHVRHNLNPCESIRGGPGIYNNIPNGLIAFNQPAFNVGKLSPASLTKTGVDDLQIKVGWNVHQTPCSYVGIYGVLFAPTGTRSGARFLFEPVIGGGHTGLGFGINDAFSLYQACDKQVTILSELRYAYFLGRNEIRSIDLKNGDWSRYLLTIDPPATETSYPGINQFTNEVKVTPRSTLDLWLALHVDACWWDLEFGYDFWWRQQEKIDLECPCPTAIYDIAGCPCRVTASTAQICQGIRGEPGAPTSDAVITLVPPCQYNLDSAAHPSSISNKLYVALASHAAICDKPAMAGIGASYEIGNEHSALSQWGIWAKTSLVW